MWLVVGLGNPGAKYERTRHNIGFQVVNALAALAGLPAWKTSKLGAELTAGVITTERGRERAVLCKPMEYMNLSGFAVQRVAAFHGVEPDQILVAHDEIDLELGVIRLKHGGGHGGHNGLRSMIEQLGGGTFARLRMGVGRDPNLPAGGAGSANAVAAWVLSDFPPAQSGLVTAMIKAGCESIQTVLAKGIAPAMNQHNARPKLSSPGTTT
jgi:peptidyl-tRNA hydrolase, PTH1 family